MTDFRATVRVLVAIDDSAFSEAASNAVIAQLRPENTEVTLLHVLEPFPMALANKLGSKEFPNFAVARVKLRDQAKEHLSRTAQKFRSAGFSISCLLEEGDPRDVILDYAERWPADLIVVGSHGRRGMSRSLMGSVSEAVAHHAHCSVEIVRMSPARGVDKAQS
jgi:universal stress protein A